MLQLPMSCNLISLQATNVESAIGYYINSSKTENNSIKLTETTGYLLKMLKVLLK